MIIELRVHNFAIIDDLYVSFHPGFNVLTGETGAGKSIIIDAIELLLGTRASQEMVRAGQEAASVEGIFALRGAAGAEAQARLLAEGLDGDAHSVILAREVRRGGRSIARINGRAVAQAMLAEIGGLLVDIHGQGQHLSLLNVRQHLILLDQFADLTGQRQALAAQTATLRDVRAELAGLRQDARELARRLDLLNYQVEEITAAALAPGEDEALEQERRRLANAEALAGQSSAIFRLLVEGNGEWPATTDQLGEAVARLEKLSRLDPALAGLAAQAQDISERLGDLAREVDAYGDSVSPDPQRLAEVEERLELIFQLKRKYGDSIAEILAFGETAAAELARLAQSETRTAHLEIEEEQLLRQIGADAGALSAARQQAGARLGREMEGELEVLRMAGTQVAVEIVQQAQADGCFVGDRRLAFDATGIDRVQFLVSANPGEPLRPLVKVASGGETARLMLALKHVLSRADATPTLIFDEIDQGIGGRVGAIVGQKMVHLAQAHQVLCVTHLAQIAAHGDYHLVVEKGVEGERTVTRVQAVAGPPRVRELAAMLGTHSEAGQQSAQELLHDVAQYKQQLAAATA
ncbi:MAG: DNA repair protein RecN [Caldilineales bacterium]|nr:DNA repair protein RecN [Caldilineales bacterium]